MTKKKSDFTNFISFGFLFFIYTFIENLKLNIESGDSKVQGLILYIQKFTKGRCLLYGFIVTVSCIASSCNMLDYFFTCRFIVQVERSALWQIRMFLGHSCKAK